LDERLVDQRLGADLPSPRFLELRGAPPFRLARLAPMLRIASRPRGALA
jgi:hypothetical protein